MNPLLGHLDTPMGRVRIVDLRRIEWIARAPYTIRVLAENIARNVEPEEAALLLEELSRWRRGSQSEIPFYPARVISQDLTGVALALDLAMLRETVARLGIDPSVVNPVVRVDLVVDHSLQVDKFGSVSAMRENMRLEAERNRDKFRLLKWAQKAFRNFRIIPPGSGIIHQVNVEQLAEVVRVEEVGGELWAMPDTVIGTDSHTPMVNALGVLGWGVGGLEAEAVILGEPYYLPVPRVVGVRLYGELKPGVTGMDVALYVTELLRKKGVVDAFVEFYGEALPSLPVWSRLPVANMAPEYGATTGFFPVDERTIEYLVATGRDEARVRLVELYAKRTGLWHTLEEEPEYSETIDLDLSSIEPSIAGPSNPFERIPLAEAKKRVSSTLPEKRASHEARLGSQLLRIEDGYVAIAAIASCTSTGSIDMLVAAGLLAKKAVERGLQVKPWVKTSFSPGSRLAARALDELGLTPYLQALRFHIVGYACATCIGNTGSLTPVAEEAAKRGVHLAAVISGNRNFAGRIHPLVKSVYLASPPLVVAYAIAGRVDIDFEKEPLDLDPSGELVYLRDIAPAPEEVSRALARLNLRKLAIEVGGGAGESPEWDEIEAPESPLYDWKPSIQVARPQAFLDAGVEGGRVEDIRGARILVLAPDNTTTDHISPAGIIRRNSPAGEYLASLGVDSEALGLTYGSMRGNYEVMVRGAFDNPGFRNLAAEKPGSRARVWPEGAEVSVFEASRIYSARGTPLVIVAGKNYGMGSSRDWAARAPRLLGVKAVIAESFERIHRRNLAAVGILPLEVRERLVGALKGDEEIDVVGLSGGLEPGAEVRVVVRKPSGETLEVPARVRLDTRAEVEYYRSGGVLGHVLRKILEKATGRSR